MRTVEKLENKLMRMSFGGNGGMVVSYFILETEVMHHSPALAQFLRIGLGLYANYQLRSLIQMLLLFFYLNPGEDDHQWSLCDRSRAPRHQSWCQGARSTSPDLIFFVDSFGITN